MADFQYKFFPDVYQVEVRHIGGVVASNPVQAAYCKYNNQLLQLVVSSLYISALFSGIVASRFARALGRKVSVLLQLLLSSHWSLLHQALYDDFLHHAC